MPLLLGAMLSCSAVPDISAELTEYDELITDTRASACRCPEDLGFANRVECDDAYGPVSIAERQCLDDAVAGSEDDAQAHLDCVNMALQSYLQCLDANVECEEGAYDACTGDYMVATAACPSMPAGVQTTFDACL
ncbi:hypothetical protein ENSA5_49270 [Enhygromyxa salina]|uniref:Uncharacterized protein n=1 Tax=Enhygromyxa salina TaxID=215803 RepID=A0A2S9XHR9_9BACT|nr:hypothetical protein [Enhygromyxa salina]PRP92419.1 hypothetical protein ENSA5_49270 [Enhygromyxa salina]